MWFQGSLGIIIVDSNTWKRYAMGIFGMVPGQNGFHGTSTHVYHDFFGVWYGSLSSTGQNGRHGSSTQICLT